MKDELLVEIARILEVDSVSESDVLHDFEMWDSLSVLAVLAFVDERYGINISALELADVEKVVDLYNLVLSKK